MRTLQPQALATLRAILGTTSTQVGPRVYSALRVDQTVE